APGRRGDLGLQRADGTLELHLPQLGGDPPREVIQAAGEDLPPRKPHPGSRGVAGRGRPGVPAEGCDAARLEELPGAHLLLSSRVASGGRHREASPSPVPADPPRRAFAWRRWWSGTDGDTPCSRGTVPGAAPPASGCARRALRRGTR